MQGWALVLPSTVPGNEKKGSLRVVVCHTAELCPTYPPQTGSRYLGGRPRFTLWTKLERYVVNPDGSSSILAHSQLPEV